ncbi:MAG: hypothetical protein IPL40_15260 [Proteobacteria bacterium]|nr:hypothetical protein [Pseudomonadota bacterium]
MSMRAERWIMERWIMVVGGCVLAALGACSDGAGDAKRACPPQGIGVAEFEGRSPAQQVLEYKQYNCAQPQICPDIGNPTAWTYGVIPNCKDTGNCPGPSQINLNLTNCSTGKQTLVIEKVQIYGDERCSFQEAAIEKKELAPGEIIAIKTDWAPASVGEDHAQFRIHSNAQNFKPLVVAFCGQAVLARSGSAAGDAGVATDGGATRADARATGLLCRDVKSITASCHGE